MTPSTTEEEDDGPLPDRLPAVVLPRLLTIEAQPLWIGFALLVEPYTTTPVSHSDLIGRSSQIVVHDLAETKRQIGNDVSAGHDLEHGQFRQRRQRVRHEIQRRRTGPGALELDILQFILDQLADARR